MGLLQRRQMKKDSQSSLTSPECNKNGGNPLAASSAERVQSSTLKAAPWQENMSLSLQKPSKSLQNFLATQVDPRDDLANGHYDIKNACAPFWSTAEDSESLSSKAGDWQHQEQRLDEFFQAEGVHCVMLHDYLQALSVHTEQERYCNPVEISKKGAFGAPREREDQSSQNKQKAKINPRRKGNQLFVQIATKPRNFESDSRQFSMSEDSSDSISPTKHRQP